MQHGQWEALPDPLFGGLTWFRRGLTGPMDCARAFDPGTGPKATAYVCRRFLVAKAATVEQAMDRLDRQIARVQKEAV